ncbi:protein FAR1-RELATED SEQUENCE 8-like [Papaver somniferum]|uniref:protein FAR1-RELATED SEQUENCE 8-like n=1 Tax=Papaver somniferum TaxID=3469 RepID=UPI000E6F923B|nr:protein FAR1-RELATED SEQUENCE 8-like [Papaver somniferum]
MNGNELEIEEPEKSGSVLDDDSNHDDQTVEPKLGMRFENVDELFEFYNNYAYKTGFSIKKRTCKKENGVPVHVSYTCSKEGKNITASNTPLNLSPTQRTGCKAKISARLCADDKWMINVVSLQHNHLNSPSKDRHLRGHKRINTATKKRVLLNDKGGIRMCKTYGELAVEGGGYENLPYDEKL